MESGFLYPETYYKALLNGKEVKNGLSVLRPEYIILFKTKAYLDQKKRKYLGEKVDSSDIKKHKKDILRIASELMLEWDICPLYGISLYWGLIPRLNSQFLCVKGRHRCPA